MSIRINKNLSKLALPNPLKQKSTHNHYAKSASYLVNIVEISTRLKKQVTNQLNPYGIETSVLRQYPKMSNRRQLMPPYNQQLICLSAIDL